MRQSEMLAGAYEEIRTRRLLELKHPDGASSALRTPSGVSQTRPQPDRTADGSWTDSIGSAEMGDRRAPPGGRRAYSVPYSDRQQRNDTVLDS